MRLAHPDADAPERAPEDRRFLRSIRLRRSADFQRVQRRGRRVRGRHLLVLFSPGTASSSRFGLVVSRKVGNAVARNRVKRWLREVIRHHHRTLTDLWDVAIVALPQAATASLRLLEADLLDAFRRLPRAGGSRKE